MIANNRGIESARTGAKADSQNLRPSFTAILDQRIRIKPNNLLSFFFFIISRFAMELRSSLNKYLSYNSAINVIK